MCRAESLFYTRLDRSADPHARTLDWRRREAQREGEVQIEARDGNVRTGVSVFLCEWPVTLIPNFDFYLNYMIFEGVTALFLKTRQFETDGNVPLVYYFNI